MEKKLSMKNRKGRAFKLSTEAADEQIEEESIEE